MSGETRCAGEGGSTPAPRGRQAARPPRARHGPARDPARPAVSEVTGLRVEHVNVKEGWIRVERLKGSLTTVQTLERHPGQPLLDEVRVLSRWLRARREDGSGVLFVSSHGGQMNRSTFARLWRRLAEAAGLPRVKWHPHVAKHTTYDRGTARLAAICRSTPRTLSRSHSGPPEAYRLAVSCE